MTVSEIIKSVRWCIDEEAVNASELADTSAYDFEGGSHSDNGLMNNIITDKIGDALRWVCLFGPATLLDGSDETKEEKGKTVVIDPGVMKDVTATPTAITGKNAGRITMPTDFIKLARIRVNGWHRAIKVPISEDSEEYLQLYDVNGATATADRPQAAVIDKTVKEIEVWPWTATDGQVEYTYVAATDGKGFETTKEGVTETHYALPPKARTAFIYYLAFLVLSAYGDARAKNMLDIAKMNLGATE